MSEVSSQWGAALIWRRCKLLVLPGVQNSLASFVIITKTRVMYSNDKISAGIWIWKWHRFDCNKISTFALTWMTKCHQCWFPSILNVIGIIETMKPLLISNRLQNRCLSREQTKTQRPDYINPSLKYIPKCLGGNHFLTSGKIWPNKDWDETLKYIKKNLPYGCSYSINS